MRRARSVASRTLSRYLPFSHECASNRPLQAGSATRTCQNGAWNGLTFLCADPSDRYTYVGTGTRTFFPFVLNLLLQTGPNALPRVAEAPSRARSSVWTCKLILVNCPLSTSTRENNGVDVPLETCIAFGLHDVPLTQSCNTVGCDVFNWEVSEWGACNTGTASPCLRSPLSASSHRVQRRPARASHPLHERGLHRARRQLRRPGGGKAHLR
jgi:hypothetical protein